MLMILWSLDTITRTLRTYLIYCLDGIPSGANIKTSQVIHARNKQRLRATVPFKLMGQQMEFVEDYKYLGCWMNEFSNHNKTVEAHSCGG